MSRPPLPKPPDPTKLVQIGDDWVRPCDVSAVSFEFIEAVRHQPPHSGLPGRDGLFIPTVRVRLRGGGQLVWMWRPDRRHVLDEFMVHAKAYANTWRGTKSARIPEVHPKEVADALGIECPPDFERLTY